MRETFISNLKINNIENLRDSEIENKQSLGHIVITGKNGSGKTTVLDSIHNFLSSLDKKEYRNVVNLNKDISQCNSSLDFLRDEEILTENSKGEINKLKNRLVYYTNKQNAYCKDVNVKICNDEELQKRFDLGEFIVLNYKARRSIDIERHIEGNEKSETSLFIEYMEQLKDREEEAIVIDDEEEMIAIRRWFNMFERLLRQITMNKETKLIYEDGEFKVKEKNKKANTFYELSDGYSSILKIVMEIMIKMERTRTVKYDVEGIVLIDEIEKHLHPQLQERVLAILTSFFPSLQFIVTTMSSKVIDGIQNIKVIDLDKLN